MSAMPSKTPRVDLGLAAYKPETVSAPAGASASRRRRGGTATKLLARGEPMVWFTGAGLVICLAMIVGLLGFVVYEGTATFWPGRLHQVTTLDGRTLLGELSRVETYRPSQDVIDALPEAERAGATAAIAEGKGEATR